MKPWLHAKVSVKKWGGKPEDYLAIHDFIDSSKMCFPDMRHRALLHSSFGTYIAERVFGHNLTNSDGREVSVRDIAEQHVIDDMGRIPTVGEYLEGMPLYDWLGGKKKEKTAVDMTPVTLEKVREFPTIEEFRKLMEKHKQTPRLPGLGTDIVD